MPSNYSNTVLSDTPQAYYRTGELSGGTAYDSSGNVRDATFQGGITQGIAGAIRKDRDTGVTLDGTSGYIDVPSSVTQGTAVTLECWIKLAQNSFTNYPRIISNDAVASANKGVEIGINQFATGIFANFGFTSTNVNISYGINFLLGVWYHVAVTYNGTKCILYLNGQNVSENSPALTLAAGTYAYDIGRNPQYTGDYFSGSIDEIAFYSSALSSTRILAHYNAGIANTFSSIFDTFFYKFQIVKVYSPSMEFIDIIKDAPLLSCKENINSAADTVKISLPRKIDAFDGAGQPGSKNTILTGNILQWWIYGAGLPDAGILRYQGVIDEINPKIGSNGAESVDVTITPFSQILGDHGFSAPVNFGTAGDASTYIEAASIFASIFTGEYVNNVGSTIDVTDAITGQPYGHPYTLDPASLTTTGQRTQVSFSNQKLISALNTILSLCPSNYFFRMNQDKTTLFSMIPVAPTYTLFLGQHIASMEYGISNIPRKNVIVVQGAGSIQVVATGTSVSSIGQRIMFKSDDRITDTNTAQLLANGLLALYDREIVRAKVVVPDYRCNPLTGLGGDVEAFQVGQTVRLIDARAPAVVTSGAGSVWGALVWGRDKWGSSATAQTLWGNFTWGQSLWSSGIGSIFNTVTTIMSIDYNYHSVTLELGARQPSLSRALFDLELRFQDATLIG